MNLNQAFVLLKQLKAVESKYDSVNKLLQQDATTHNLSKALKLLNKLKD